MAGGHAWLGDLHGLGGVHGWVMCMAVERHAWLGWRVWLGVGVHCWGGTCMGEGGLCTVWSHPAYYTIGKRTVHIILEC